MAMPNPQQFLQLNGQVDWNAYNQAMAQYNAANKGNPYTEASNAAATLAANKKWQAAQQAAAAQQQQRQAAIKALRQPQAAPAPAANNAAANNAGGMDPNLANMLGLWGMAGGNALGNMANAGASMWNASQNGLANVMGTGIQAQVAQQLGQQAFANQAQQIANNYNLGNNQLSTLSNLTNAGYQNNLDKINALMKGMNPLLSGIGSGQAFGSLGTGLANMAGGYGNGSLGAAGPLGSGGLMGFQSSNGTSAALPTAGGMGTYNTGISMNPAMSAAQQQGNVNALAGAYNTAAPQTVNAQTTPAARSTLANMMAQRGASGARGAATNLDRYQQAAAAKLGYDQQATNAQTADSLQRLLAGMYGQNLNRQLGYQQTGQQGQLGRMGAASSLMNSAMGAGTGLLGGMLG